MPEPSNMIPVNRVYPWQLITHKAKSILTGEWVAGMLIYELARNDEDQIEYLIPMLRRYPRQEDFPIMDYKDIMVDPDTLRPFTGIIDQVGNPIYLGSRVATDTRHGEVYETEVIHGYSGYRLKDNKTMFADQAAIRFASILVVGDAVSVDHSGPINGGPIK